MKISKMLWLECPHKLTFIVVTIVRSLILKIGVVVYGFGGSVNIRISLHALAAGRALNPQLFRTDAPVRSADQCGSAASSRFMLRTLTCYPESQLIKIAINCI